MRNIPLIAATAVLAAMLSLPANAGAETYKAVKTGRCYEILKEGFINKHWTIYKCRACQCAGKNKEAVGFETIREAIDYLERKYGELEPR